jgi:hypothetical protein
MNSEESKCRKRYYVAGPMRGVAEFNFPAFFNAAETLRNFGYEVFNPAERDRSVGFDPSGMAGTNEELLKAKHCIRQSFQCDTEFICLKATHIFMLPGWSRSTGATAERALGVALGLVIEGAPA